MAVIGTFLITVLECFSFVNQITFSYHLFSPRVRSVSSSKRRFIYLFIFHSLSEIQLLVKSTFFVTVT